MILKVYEYTELGLPRHLRDESIVDSDAIYTMDIVKDKVSVEQQYKLELYHEAGELLKVYYVCNPYLFEQFKPKTK